MMKVHYISFLSNSAQRRKAPSGISKIEYMIDALQDVCSDTVVVSTAPTIKRGYSPSEIYDKVLYLPSLNLPGKVGAKVSMMFMQVMLLKYLLLNVTKDDVVIYYHSLPYAWPLLLAKHLKTLCLVMEFNDKYSYHYVQPKKAKKVDKIEQKMIAGAQAYVFASPMMRNVIAQGKEYVINYGSYKPAKKEISSLHESGCKIHLLYSGVIEPLRCAAELAVETMRFLPEEYVLHVAGFGNDAAYVESVEKKIEEINRERNSIVYYGFLEQDRLSELMHKCHISLSTHTYEHAWQADLSFPSKIPLNMAHGLYMVSAELPVIVNSPFADAMCFYHESDGRKIAAAIMRCNKKRLERKCEPKEIVKRMDNRFRKDLRKLITTLLHE